MTPYEDRLSPRAEKDYEPPEGCHIVSLNMVLRHGSRYPTDTNVAGIAFLRTIIDEHMSNLKMDWMKTWQPDFDMDHQGLLCDRGVAEHRALGVNTSRFFKDAVLPYNANEVQFTCTYKDRTSQSAEAFGNAMVNDKGKTPIAVTSVSKEDDIILRFFSNCPRYTKEIHDNPEKKEQARKWMAAHIDDLANHVTERTGLPIDSMGDKRTSIIDTMWSACQSQYVVLNKTDQWCSVFTDVDIKTLEFYDDLSAFYIKSYGDGNDLSYKISSPLLADIIENMRSSANPVPDDFKVRANIRFAHAETILPFSALLGLFHAEGEILTADMTWEEIDNRTFRIGAVSPLASNIAFAQYQCDGQNETQVELMHNGYMYPIRGCNSRLCPLSTVINSFQEELEFAKKFNEKCQDTQRHQHFNEEL